MHEIIHEILQIHSSSKVPITFSCVIKKLLPIMARVRKLTDEQRRSNKLASQAAWREKNREYTRKWAAMNRLQPGNAEKQDLYRKALYRRQRAELFSAGFVPNPVGRPRKIFSVEIEIPNHAPFSCN